MARRMVQYEDVAPSLVDTSTLNPLKSGTELRQHWTNEGKPMSASAARKYRRVMTLLAAGNVDDAEALLLRMGPAKDSVEIKEALLWAKKKKSSFEDATAQKDDSDVVQEENSKACDDADEFSEDAQTTEEYHGQSFDPPSYIPAGTSFNFHGAFDDGSGRHLTHAEIWDDSALIDAWDAAMEEYKDFDQRRKNSTPSANRKGKSALWYSSPGAGSSAAREAKASAHEEQKQLEELEARKKHARGLLEKIPKEPLCEQQLSVAVQSEQSLPSRKRKKVKGVVPPSSSIPGNAAWHSACAIVSQTPNQVGEQSVQSLPNLLPSLDNAHQHQSAFDSDKNNQSQSGATSSHDTNTPPEDVLQNLAMSWYYAGYYQAMAAAMYQR